ncbi:DUF1080 domain-containing protein [Microbacterium sp. NPDC056736]|uniref:3-keto-disaccharide hydrolase n=1 Tax=Microbacterium sp. NPDC056736 TaxID=3345932 RepID=UPI003670E268
MTTQTETGYESLFNGEDLDGWFATPRVYGPMWIGGPTLRELQADRPAGARFTDEYFDAAPNRPAAWTVEDGAIVGRQDEPGSGFGGFLLTERTFGDFELVLEANPDWPADSGILVRKTRDSWRGFQILVDHRKSGSIGGYYGNGLGGFHAVSFNLDADLDEDGQLVRLREEDPATTLEPLDGKHELLTYGATADEFLAAWNPGGWNELRIRVVGLKPVITTWINGVKISEIDLAHLDFPNYDADAVAETLGSRGHIALEVHDTDPKMGEARWGRDSACRWRNIRVKELS